MSLNSSANNSSANDETNTSGTFMDQLLSSGPYRNVANTSSVANLTVTTTASSSASRYKLCISFENFNIFMANVRIAGSREMFRLWANAMNCQEVACRPLSEIPAEFQTILKNADQYAHQDWILLVGQQFCNIFVQAFLTSQTSQVIAVRTSSTKPCSAESSYPALRLFLMIHLTHTQCWKAQRSYQLHAQLENI